MIYDIAIIGAGPAGLTAAIYACRAEKKTIVFEAKTFGGQIVNASDIENYPAAMHISGFELAKKMYDQATELGAEFEFEKVLSISENDDRTKTIKTEDSTFLAKTIIIATGAKSRKLGIENEDKLVGHGVSYCATCDGAFYRDKIVAVQGGGNTAFEDAIYLAKLAKKVFLLHRNENFRAEKKLVDNASQLENVEIIPNSQVITFIIDGKNNLEIIKYKNTITGEINDLPISGFFIAIGQIPETAEFSELVETDGFGYIKSNENCRTNLSGIFVAGDCRKKNVRQLVTATSDGAVSAIEAINYLNK